MMHPSSIIVKKRDGGVLDPADISFFVDGYVRGEIPDYQMSALAMAIFLRGMDHEETVTLTEKMLASGKTLCWDSGSVPKVDKHSTGGIGDKVSIILAPLLACCDLHVPMLSGRGLGTTGGTLDKLESISGFRADLNIDEIQRLTERVGCVITGTTEDLAPADRKLYALRDVTGTVPSIPLIVASIMSKKLAENVDALVLDVKFGSGAFMKSIEEARQLAFTLVEVGQRMNVKTTALLTDMNQPLGRMVGNAVEVDEAVEVLKGNGPTDLMELTLGLSSELLVSTGRASTTIAAQKILHQQISSGKALEKFLEMVEAQGGDPHAHRKIASASEVTARRNGYVHTINAEILGLAAIEMGGGRKVQSNSVDHSVGLKMLVRLGDVVDKGQPMVRVFAPGKLRSQVESTVAGAISIKASPPHPTPLIAQRISAIT